MSQGVSDQQEEPSVPKRVYRTVTPEYFGRPDFEMTVIGITYFVVLLVLLVPLLPFIAIIWVFGWVMDRYRRDTESE